MLILQRSKGQSIYIGDQIKVHFLNSIDGAIKVGIEAPKEIVILRNEILGKSTKRRKCISTQHK
jgi:carbon storage regulator